MEVTDTPVTNDGTEEIRRKKRSVRQDQDILFAVRSNLLIRLWNPTTCVGISLRRLAFIYAISNVSNGKYLFTGE